MSDLLDLPPAYGGIGLLSLERVVDEELLGSFAGISASLIAFCRRTELPVYIAIAEALELMGDAEDMLNGEDSDTLDGHNKTVGTIRAIRSATTRAVTDPPRTTNFFLPHS
jgi:hypothetical protein